MQPDHSRTAPGQGGRSKSPQASVDTTTVQPTLDIDGAARRDAGMAAAEHGAEVIAKRLVAAAIEQRARDGWPFTSDQIHEDVPTAGGWPNMIGARFNAAARAGIITKVGYRPSDRPSRHRAVIAVWVGTAEARKVAA